VVEEALLALVGKLRATFAPSLMRSQIIWPDGVVLGRGGERLCPIRLALLAGRELDRPFAGEVEHIVPPPSVSKALGREPDGSRGFVDTHARTELSRIFGLRRRIDLPLPGRLRISFLVHPQV
jgi:hypothetical protein